MLEATRMPTFASWVGVAPSTTTMQLGAAERPHFAPGLRPHGVMRAVEIVKAGDAPASPKPAPKKKKPASRPPHIRRRYYVPYASIEDLRAANGLGIINESDAWMTGRPYGLPGTATIRLDQQHGGYHNPDGYHYNAAMVGGGFGADDPQATIVKLQEDLLRQKRITNALMIMTIATTALTGIGFIFDVMARRNEKRYRRGGR